MTVGVDIVSISEVAVGRIIGAEEDNCPCCFIYTRKCHSGSNWLCLQL